MINTSGRDVRNGDKSLDHSIPADADRHALDSQLRECFGRCAYTHKTHEKMAERNASRLRRIKWAQIILAGLTTGGAVGVIFDENSLLFKYGTAILAISLLILNSYLKDVDPGQLAQKHREVASDIWNVREAYLSLLTDIRDPNFSLAELRKRRDDLQKQLYEIYRPAPNTDSSAYSKAQKALKENEELTFSDAEIDAFLPDPLKRLTQNDGK